MGCARNPQINNDIVMYHNLQMCHASIICAVESYALPAIEHIPAQIYMQLLFRNIATGEFGE